MQENKSNRHVPQSELRRKLELRLKERGFKKSLSRGKYGLYDESEEEVNLVRSVFGFSLCWIICISLGVFIYVNSTLENNFSRGVIERTEIYLDGSKGIDTYWESFRSWVNDLRRSGIKRMD